MMLYVKWKLGEELGWQKLHITRKKTDSTIKEDKHYALEKRIPRTYIWSEVLHSAVKKNIRIFKMNR